MMKAVILIGGPQKGTRFRPLSFEVPKPLFRLAGYPIIYHHIGALSQVTKYHFISSSRESFWIELKERPFKVN